MFKEYASCSFYTLLCKYESLRLSLKCALRAHDIQHAKILAAQLSELGYLPRERDGTASDMRLRINTLIMNIRERYDCLAELSDVPGCCVCMDALNEMTDLITDNQEDDEVEYSLCSSYPILCKYEVFNKNIKESLRNRQIDRAKRLKNLLNSLEHDPQRGIIGATAADVKERLKSAEVRLKGRYVSSAERADIDDSIYCSEMLGKVQHLLTEGERATAQAVFESENDTIQPTESSFSGFGQSYNSSSESDDYILHGRSNRELNSNIQNVPAIGMGTPSVYSYLDVSSPIKVSKGGGAGIGGNASISVKSPSQSYISKYLAASSAAFNAENSVLNGKWWLDDETRGKN